MSHAGFASHPPLPRRDHTVLFHSGRLTILQVVQGGKTCQRKQSHGISLLCLREAAQCRGNSKGHLREEHHLINNTASIRYYTQKAKQYPKISVHREVRITHILTGGRVAHGLPALHFMGRESDNPLPHFSGGPCHVLIPNRTGAASGVAQK